MEWELLRTFEVTNRTRSFAAAARELGIEHTTVRRRITALEEQLDCELFERSTRGLVPTDAAKAVAIEVERMAIASVAAVRAAEQITGDLSEPVRITAAPLFSSLLVRGLAPLVETNPNILLEFVEGKDYMNLARREVDLALRVRPEGVPAASEDVPVRRLGQLRFAAYAPVGWDHRLLHEAPVLAYNDASPSDPALAFMSSLPVAPPVGASANSIQVLAEMVAMGMGWAVLPELSPDGWPGAVRRADTGVYYVAWLALQGTRRSVPAVRLVADRLVELWSTIDAPRLEP